MRAQGALVRGAQARCVVQSTTRARVLCCSQRADLAVVPGDAGDKVLTIHGVITGWSGQARGLAFIRLVSARLTRDGIRRVRGTPVPSRARVQRRIRVHIVCYIRAVVSSSARPGRLGEPRVEAVLTAIARPAVSDVRVGGCRRVCARRTRRREIATRKAEVTRRANIGVRSHFSLSAIVALRTVVCRLSEAFAAAVATSCARRRCKGATHTVTAHGARTVGDGPVRRFWRRPRSSTSAAEVARFA